MVTLNRRIYGVDFSGARNAGANIWVAAGSLAGEALRVDACRRADTLAGSGEGRERCLSALRSLVVGASEAALGFDFPFGLPASLVDDYGDWESFVLAFPDRYGSADAFRQACREATGGRELKRVTDRESRAPFSAYNVRLYRQTYYGIRDLLHPLVRDRAACVLPIQEPLPHKPWLLEVCPASTLKRERLYRPYKGPEPRKREAREHILGALEDRGRVVVPGRETRTALLENRGGDALDSVIAALATAEALRDPNGLIPLADESYRLEGYVYV